MNSIEAKDVYHRSLMMETDRGWDFGVGDPESWKFQDKLLVPNGELLDLGIGPAARSSFSFAMREMNVIGIDSNPENIKSVKAIAEASDLPIKAIEGDVSEMYLGVNQYDTILLSQLFVHFETPEKCYEVLEKVQKALKPNGHLWLRAAGLDDNYFDLLANYAKYGDYGVSKLNDNAFLAPCACSGERRMDPHLFLDPMETLGKIADLNMELVHTQVIPSQGSENIMYGEDWDGNNSFLDKHAMITAIARKK